MQARILKQDLFNEDDLKSESQVSIAKIKGTIVLFQTELYEFGQHAIAYNMAM